MIDVEVALLRLEESRQARGHGNEGDELAGELYALIQRIGDRSQLNRLVLGLPHADQVRDRAEQVLTASPVDRSDAELLELAERQVDAMVQRARDQLEPCTPSELEAFERLASLPVVVLDKTEAGTKRYCVDYGLGYAEPRVMSEQDCDDIAECEGSWPIYAESLAPGWSYVAQAFDRLAEDNAYLVRWVLAPATEGALPTEAMYEIWLAGAQLWVQGDRIAVVRGAADAVANGGYSPTTAPPIHANDAVRTWVKEVGPVGKVAVKLANDAIKASAKRKSKPLYLYLDGLDLPSVPPVHNMADWDYVTISNSPGVDLTGIERFTTITNLSLTGNELRAVPDNVRELGRLESLVLADNPIEELPDWLAELHQLTSLGLGKTSLRALPESVGALSHLSGVLLNNNEFDQVPPVFKNLSDLTTLRLDHNGITELPDWITTLDKLEELNLEGNEIAALPDNLGDLKNLRVLRLADNNIEHIPTSIERLQHLTELGLARNPLKAVPRELLDLPDTCSLNIRGGDIPRELSKARRVSKLREIWAEPGE